MMLSIFIMILALLTMLIQAIIAFKIREDLTFLDFVALVLIHLFLIVVVVKTWPF